MEFPTAIKKMHGKRKLFKYIYMAIIVIGYYVLLFSDIGNFFHGGTLASFLIMMAVYVFAVFSAHKLAVQESKTLMRVLCYISALPFVFAIFYFLLQYSGGILE